MNTEPLRDLSARHTPAHDNRSAPVPAEVVRAEPIDAQPSSYPQVIVVQGREDSSWLREHAGHLIAAAGIGVLGLAVLAVVALIAVALCLAAITTAVAVVAIQGIAASSNGRGSR
jgi:hypothetical protein